jgi:tetratricopeptide (TPR) repeat protein
MFLEEDNLEANEWLRDGESVVFYNEDNLLELLRHYLGSEEERARVAEAGRAAIEALAGEQRMDALLDAIWETESGGRRFHELPPETQAFAEAMQYASSMVLGQRQYVASMLPRWRRVFPDSVDFLTASGCVGLESLNDMQADRGRISHSVRNWLLRAGALAPDAAVTWLNLAHFAKRTRSAELREHFLLKTLEANSIEHGGLLVGAFSDPYYIAWRRAMAYGEARVELLHAWARAQLAALSLDRGDFAGALKRAEESIRLAHQFPLPHQIMAAAESAMGNVAKAAEILEASLALTAFDAAHRTALMDACMKSGRHEAAYTYAAQSRRLFTCRRMPGEAANGSPLLFDTLPR